MTNGNSGLFKGTMGDTIGKLQEELEQEKKTSQYWKNRCEGIEHDHEMLMKTLGEFEEKVKENDGYLTTLKERFAEVVAENHILKQSCFFGNDKRAHDIALAALKWEWKKGGVNPRNGDESMVYYIVSYKYVLGQLEADQNKE